MPQYRPIIALGLAATGSLVAAAPCDIYATGNTPCIAAHSTTRSLYDDYTDALYQVSRVSDSTTTDISPVKAGGIADAAAQDSFCANTDCEITIIYDQSGKKNHLTRAPPGGFKGPADGGYDAIANATGAPITLNGQKVYGVKIEAGMGYRKNGAVGTATGNDPEGMYAVIDGTDFNDQCCFDYGNAETSNTDTGAGHMEAIYFGTNTAWGKGAGNGPWLMGDLEDGLFGGKDAKYSPEDPSITSRFFTAILKGEPNHWALRGGDATTGDLSTYFDGERPNGYDPMHIEGSIILGIGGDNSPNAQGTFYEGIMTSSFPSDETENKVHADIVAAKYGVSN
ncbi:hypothetical protein VI817_008131 [Penicillium citrinum]|nr:hypothetical protein VI817_008131 [Penicillium citrinum]